MFAKESMHPTTNHNPPDSVGVHAAGEEALPDEVGGDEGPPDAARLARPVLRELHQLLPVCHHGRHQGYPPEPGITGASEQNQVSPMISTRRSCHQCYPPELGIIKAI